MNQAKYEERKARLKRIKQIRLERLRDYRDNNPYYWQFPNANEYATLSRKYVRTRDRLTRSYIWQESKVKKKLRVQAIEMERRYHDEALF